MNYVRYYCAPCLFFCPVIGIQFYNYYNSKITRVIGGLWGSTIEIDGYNITVQHPNRKVRKAIWNFAKDECAHCQRLNKDTMFFEDVKKDFLGIVNGDTSCYYVEDFAGKPCQVFLDTLYSGPTHKDLTKQQQDFIDLMEVKKTINPTHDD